MSQEPTTQRPVRSFPEGSEGLDTVVVEEPLEIRVEGESLAVLLRTPGNDIELVEGFLRTEGIIEEASDLSAVAHIVDPTQPRNNTVDVRLAAGVSSHREQLDRARREIFATSSCGICGKASIDRIHLAGEAFSKPSRDHARFLDSMQHHLDQGQPVFEKTGGLHAAALMVRDRGPLCVREDVGRHNAVDKVIGWLLRQPDIDPETLALVVSSRAGFEIVQKAFVARIPTVAAFGAASSLAIDLARASNMNLYGFLRPNRFNEYTQVNVSG